MRWTVPLIAFAVFGLASCETEPPVPRPPSASSLRPATTDEAQHIAMNWHRHCFGGSIYRSEKYLGRVEMVRFDIAPRYGRYYVSENVLCTKIGAEPDRCRALFVGPSGPAIYITDARDIRGTNRWISCRPS